ncbi:MAG: protein kinase, partial [bacterium]
PTEKIRLLKLALKDSPGFLNARLELAKTHIRMEQYRSAIVQLDSALNDDFRNAYVWNQKGHAHAKLKEYSDALKSINRAIKLIDNVPEFYMYLGQVHCEMKSYHKALKAFERALIFAIAEQDSDREADAWYWQGRVHVAAADTMAAMNAFKRALELKAGHREAKARLTEIERLSELENLYRHAQTGFAQENWQQAKGIYLAIFRKDSTFRDVSQKLAAVEKQLAAIKRAAAENNPVEEISQPSAKNTPEPKPTISAVTLLDSFSRPAQIQEPHAGSAPGSKSLGGTALIFFLSGIGVLVIVGILFVMKRKKQSGLPTIDLPNNVFKTELQRYRIEEELGRGSMGQVYKAYDKKLERSVGLKVIRLETAMEKDEIEERILRFRREAKATARLNHPNIVSLYDYDEKDGTFFMTMEYVEGASVQELLEKNTVLEIEQAVKIVKETCLALEYAHRQDLIHRDIKPSNIMLDKENRVKILDFGVAKMLNVTQAQSHTLTGMRLGSPSYMSPEQINAGILDGRSDIFGLGVVLYEILTGERPFQVNEGDSLAQLFYLILNEEPVKPSSVRKEVPSRFDAIVDKMLAKDPEERYPNAGDVIVALQA